MSAKSFFVLTIFAILTSTVLSASLAACGQVPEGGSPSTRVSPSSSPTPALSEAEGLTNTPKPTKTPTAIATPTETPTPPAPMIEVGGLQIPDPKASNPELFDLTSPDSPIVQFANAFGVTPEEVGNLTPQLLTGIDGKQFVVMTTGDLAATANFDESNTPLIMAEQGENGEWGWIQATPSRYATLTGRDIVTRLEDPGLTAQIATKIKMEVNGDAYSIYNKNFDWTKITTDWDNVYEQLQKNTIPFESEIFDQTNVGKAQVQINFANLHSLIFVGDTLFYPKILKDPMLKKLNTDQKKQVLIFMALAKIIKFPDIREINLISELAAFQQWQSDIEPTFSQIGGLNFIHDLAIAVKQIRPNIKLTASEDMIINDQKSAELQRNYDSFFNILAQLKKNGTPLDGVNFENFIWVNAPPTESSIATPLKKVQDLELTIAGPDTVIATGNKNPHWANWPATTGLATPEEEASRQAQILYLLCKTYFANGAQEFGFSEPQNPDWAGTNGDIFTFDGRPTQQFFALLKALAE